MADNPTSDPGQNHNTSSDDIIGNSSSAEHFLSLIGILSSLVLPFPRCSVFYCRPQHKNENRSYGDLMKSTQPLPSHDSTVVMGQFRCNSGHWLHHLLDAALQK